MGGKEEAGLDSPPSQVLQIIYCTQPALVAIGDHRVRLIDSILHVFKYELKPSLGSRGYTRLD